MNICKRFKIGARLLLCGFIFNFLETWYFGWNIKPQSNGEMICDYISGFLMILGYLAIVWSQVKGSRYYDND
jgi:hypothetical protein